ncbi:hypothetical protein BXT86_06655 [candidate division WOR-3 bacterium 4484_100]|uniref:TGS domain-containing protein n=1 Tax=candidate division WOR-3 bacterium 4484_100 TaxID=1936077 RepID=A0A1V4QEJ1_UNCW3|nr:MAG: hypothetical protein BXT86_06655 [candidate division WOR-3 bacterium 4484_100]
MPANLPPQYFEIEKKYREAKEPREKLVYLQQLLAVVPKHKGTEKLQAELKTKMSKLREAIKKRKRSGGSGGSWFQVEKQGAGQVVLVGLPNSGKSTLLNTLTNARAEVGSYPFTTNLPQIGMLEYEDIKIQIVDTPPLHKDAPPWLFGLYRNGDLLLIVLDCTNDPFSDFQQINDIINERNIFIKKNEFGDIKDAIIVLNKYEMSDAQVQTDSFLQQYQTDYRIIIEPGKDMIRLENLKKTIFDALNIIRVYTKKIGHPIDKKDPVVFKKGTTVIEAAEYIHKDFKKNLKFARLWNDSGYKGQRVEKSYILADGDIIEFHI